jgi:ornithine cyclodeaminase/alanine dehydrogenase-like protein (mu-crystallin family)
MHLVEILNFCCCFLLSIAFKVRTGAAGAVSMKYTTPEDGNTVGFIGCGAIARNMARAAASVRPSFQGVVYGLDGAEEFAAEMSSELGIPFTVAASSEELCKESNVIFTQTPGSDTVLELDWLQPGTTIIASGSDQPTKQESTFFTCAHLSMQNEYLAVYLSTVNLCSSLCCLSNDSPVGRFESEQIYS